MGLYDGTIECSVVMSSAGLEQTGNSQDKGVLLLIQGWHLLCLWSVVVWDPTVVGIKKKKVSSLTILTCQNKSSNDTGLSCVFQILAFLIHTWFPSCTNLGLSVWSLCQGAIRTLLREKSILKSFEQRYYL